MSSDEPRFSYDEIADAYATAVDTAPFNALYERPAMLALLPPVAGARILDAGCGSGWYAEQLAGRGARVSGIDASERMVEYARQRLSRASYPNGAKPQVRVADLSAPLEFAASETFDGIVSPLVLHYLRDWRPTFREFGRVLKPGGWLLFSTHHPGTEAQRFATARYFEIEHVEDEWGFIGRVEFYRRPLMEIAESLADSGFMIERIVEPVPTEEFRREKPDSYHRLLRQPEFLIVLARRKDNR